MKVPPFYCIMYQVGSDDPIIQHYAPIAGRWFPVFTCKVDEFDGGRSVFPAICLFASKAAAEDAIVKQAEADPTTRRNKVACIDGIQLSWASYLKMAHAFKEWSSETLLTHGLPCGNRTEVHIYGDERYPRVPNGFHSLLASMTGTKHVPSQFSFLGRDVNTHLPTFSNVRSFCDEFKLEGLDEVIELVDGPKRDKQNLLSSSVPRYCIFVGGYALMRFNPSANIIAHMFFTDRAKLKMFCDEMFRAGWIKCSKEDIKIYSLGEDLSIADYLVAAARHLQESHMIPFFISPEKLMECPVLVDMFDFSNDTDKVVDVLKKSNAEDLKVLVDKSLTLKELLLKYRENQVMDYGTPEVTHYKGYTVFIQQHCQDGDYSGVTCKGTFNSREEAIGQDSLRVFDFLGTKESVIRRIKAWVDQQSVIDEKNQRKAERKAQREEQAEANKPFKWFVPHKLAGWAASGAIENDGTIVKKSSKETSDFVTISNTIGNLWDALGNRRWFVNGDIVKFIKHANVPDTRMDGLFFPYDCFYVIFENSADPERRFMIRNRTIQYLRVVRVKSEQACRLIKDDSIVPLFMPYKCVISIVTSTDSSKEVFEGAVFIDIADSSKIPEGVGSAEEKAQIQRIVVALLLLYSGRVEIFKKYTIPRSQRYELNKGIKDQHKDNNEVITMMPLKKLVVEDPKPSDGTGSKKKTHMRGWCLDTLRHPRYKRNPDGTLRTRIRPPCIINDPEKEV